jgi:hypothetical protein
MVSSPKVLLFGKPNYTISEHYGDSMSGFVRADNPDSGPNTGNGALLERILSINWPCRALLKQTVVGLPCK